MKEESDPLSQRKRIFELVVRARRIWKNEDVPSEFRMMFYGAWCSLQQLLGVDTILRSNVEFFLNMGLTELVRQTLSQREDVEEAIEEFERLLTQFESRQ